MSMANHCRQVFAYRSIIWMGCMIGVSGDRHFAFTLVIDWSFARLSAVVFICPAFFVVFACRLVIITADCPSVYFVMGHTSLSIDWTLVERKTNNHHPYASSLVRQSSLSNGRQG